MGTKPRVGKPRVGSGTGFGGPGGGSGGPGGDFVIVIKVTGKPLLRLLQRKPPPGPPEPPPGPPKAPAEPTRGLATRGLAAAKPSNSTLPLRAASCATWLVYLQFRGTREKLQGGFLDLFNLFFG